MNRTAAVTKQPIHVWEHLSSVTDHISTHHHPPPWGRGLIYMTAADGTEHMKERNTETCDVHNDIVFLLVPSYVTVKLLCCMQHGNPCFNHSHHSVCHSLMLCFKTCIVVEPKCVTALIPQYCCASEPVPSTSHYCNLPL